MSVNEKTLNHHQLVSLVTGHIDVISVEIFCQDKSHFAFSHIPQNWTFDLWKGHENIINNIYTVVKLLPLTRQNTMSLSLHHSLYVLQSRLQPRLRPLSSVWQSSLTVLEFVSIRPGLFPPHSFMGFLPGVVTYQGNSGRFICKH